jgi:hypothetical protein
MMTKNRDWLLAILLIVACGGCSRRVLTSATSPDGQFKVEVISEDYLVDSTIFVKLQGTTVGHTVQDFAPAISQIAWLPNSQIFGVIVFDKLGSDYLFAFDAANHREVDFSIVKPTIAKALLARYSEQASNDVTAELDPIKWVADQRRLGRIPND